MKLSYRHANITAGNESFLLSYQPDSRSTGASCVLVDAGTGLDVANLLDPADDLVAVCLTHAHADHYQSLGECVRAGATVYTSPSTADIFGDVADIAARQLDGESLGVEAGDVRPVDGWTALAPGVSVHPVPAGHAPGAVGYLFEFADGADSHHVLATGDFTRRRAAGYPGIDTSLADIDVLFCTVATSEGFEANLSEGLGHALHRAHTGARTLVATSGLFGVQVTYLLNALARELGLSVTVRPVGHVASLYETLGYSGRHVDPTAVFDDPAACLEQGAISVAGPETPTEGSSERLFHRLRDDPNGCVVQLYHSESGSFDTGRCTVHSYETVNHPPREALEEVHDALAPSHTVVVHQHGGAGSKFNHLDSTVWAPTDGREYTLYQDGWQTPPWMGRRHASTDTTPTGTLRAQIETDLTDELTLPPITRHDTADLTSEGVDLERVEAIVDQSRSTGTRAPRQRSTADTSTKYRGSTAGGTATPTGPQSSHSGAEQTGTVPGDTETTTEQMRQTSSSTGSPDAESESDPDSEHPHPGGMVDSLRTVVDGVDPWIRDAIDRGAVDPDELVSALELSTEARSPPVDEDGPTETDRVVSEEEGDGEPPTEEPESTPAGESERTPPADPESTPTADSDQTPATDSDQARATDSEPTPATDSEPTPAADSESTPAGESGGGEGTGAAGAEADDTETDTPGRDGSSVEHAQSAGDGTETRPPGQTRARSTAREGSATGDSSPDDEQTVALELSAFTVMLAEHAVEDRGPGTVVGEAVPAFLESLLVGEEPSTSTLSGDLSGGPAGDTLGAVAASEPDVDDVVALIRTSVTQYVGADSRTVPVPGVEPYLPLVDAVAANKTTDTTSRSAVITRAVEYYIARQ